MEFCRWWCSNQPIPVGTPASPGKVVDCMSCLVNPPEEPKPAAYAGSTSGRPDRVIMISTPSGSETKIFDAKTRSIQRTVKTGRRTIRRRR